MEQITVTAKIQIKVSQSDKENLVKTMVAYKNACNFVSEYIFKTHDLKQFAFSNGSVCFENSNCTIQNDS